MTEAEGMHESVPSLGNVLRMAGPVTASSLVSYCKCNCLSGSY